MIALLWGKIILEINTTSPIDAISSEPYLEYIIIINIFGQVLSNLHSNDVIKWEEVELFSNKPSIIYSAVGVIRFLNLLQEMKAKRLENCNNNDWPKGTKVGKGSVMLVRMPVFLQVRIKYDFQVFFLVRIKVSNFLCSYKFEFS